MDGDLIGYQLWIRRMQRSMVIGMVVFGGRGTLWGPVLGALLLYGLYEGLRFVGVVYNLVAVGFVIMVFVIFFPRGLAGFGRSA
jgi:branched-chain amino acid transport system permease protein